MATSIVGAVGSFDPSTTQWKSYIEQMEEFFLANDIKGDRKKVAILLSTVGSQTYELIKDLISPAKPNAKSFEELVTCLQDHLQPKPTIIAERYKFHQRNQGPNETVSEYLAALRRAATECQFEGFLAEALHDRLVCGLTSEPLRRRLLLEKDLSLTKATEIAVAMEAADKDSKIIQTKSNEDVNAVQKTNQQHRAMDKTVKPTMDTCYRCGRKGHKPQSCRFREAQCRNCGKTGHIAAACRNRVRPQGTQASMQKLDSENEEEEELSQLNGMEERDIQTLNSKPLMEVHINGQLVWMEIDTGAAVSVVSQKNLKIPMKKSSKQLQSATGQILELAGEAKVKVKVKGMKKVVRIYIAKGECPSLFGREWINTFFGKDWLQRLVNIKAISKQGVPPKLQTLLDKYSKTVFKPGLGKLRGITAKLTLRPEAIPKFHKPRPMPYAMRPKVEATLTQMVKEGNIEKVECSDWATPVVPVMKPDGSVRICGDYKVTLNPCLQVPQHPIPRAEECFHAVNGGKKFTKLDLAQAYNQIMLDEASKQFTIMNTHWGLYRWCRLPFGVAASPAIFQGIMDKVLHGLNYVVWYLDDILVSGENDQQHLENLAEVLNRLEKYGLRGRLSKCQFFQDSVEYLGHEISQEGIRPLEKKVEAIKQAPTPKTVEQLESFLGMIKNLYPTFRL